MDGYRESWTEHVGGDFSASVDAGGMPGRKVPAPTRHSLLWIDGDPEFGKVVRGHFPKCGFDVTLAEDGVSGMQMLVAGEFDAIVLELDLPHLSGLEVLRRIRAEGMPVMPRVIVVSSADPGYADRAHELGASAVYRKPVNLTQLAADLRRVVGLPREMR